MELVVTSAGLIRSIYDETINLKSLGQVHIRRGSHVEPDELGAGRPTCHRSAAPFWGHLNNDVRPWQPKSPGCASIGSHRRRIDGRQFSFTFRVL